MPNSDSSQNYLNIKVSISDTASCRCRHDYLHRPVNVYAVFIYRVSYRT